MAAEVINRFNWAAFAKLFAAVAEFDQDISVPHITAAVDIDKTVVDTVLSSLKVVVAAEAAVYRKIMYCHRRRNRRSSLRIQRCIPFHHHWNRQTNSQMLSLPQ